MLGSLSPATATISTTTTPASSPRPSRLRGLSYLRSYTHSHLHTRSSDIPRTLGAPPPLTRSTSTPAGDSPLGSPRDLSTARDPELPHSAAPGIQSGENGWVPTVQGRSGLSRGEAGTETSTDPASPEPAMTRHRAHTTSSGALPSAHLAAERTSPTDDEAAPPTALHSDAEQHPAAGARSGTAKVEVMPTIRFIPHQEARSARPSLQFDALSRTLKTHTSMVRVGRYSERDQAGAVASAAVIPVGFKSKVVSRRHCEFWCRQGQWYIKDAKSSSGTFLNHVRLSSPGQESQPFPVNDGDVVQLGIDFKGGEEVIFRSVKIRVECNRGWQKSLNSFNTLTHRRLRDLAKGAPARDSDALSAHSSECSICLNPVAPCQALFVAPCSHVWHYKCVRDLLHGPNYPNFLCPNCRFVADLGADVEQPEPEPEAEKWEELDETSEEEEKEKKKKRNTSGSGGRDTGTERKNDSQAAQGASHDDDDNDDDDLDDDDDDNLAALLRQSTLTPAPRLPSPTPSPARSSSSRRAAHAPPPPSTIPLPARPHTPTSQIALALADAGPMTPRNDAGPFVLDGSGGGVEGGMGEEGGR